MQIFKAASILALAANAVADLTQYQFFAESDNQDINGHGLYYYDEGGSTNYYFIANDTDASSASTVTYDSDTQEFYHQVSPQQKYVVTDGTNSVFQLSGSGQPLTGDISSNGVVFFGSPYKLSAVKNIGDPKGYSDYNYGILTTEVANGISVTIIAKKV
ncbi:hypothetical protein KGF57_000025 [Candida theae]|uniref:Uncharacterized protein n=1 Tax=Candida theae TaxID=1198502 RepID=A0AAD5G129_9ASCO|nr:uncharacterized protein KGF57_000025 [Candida theae]KAI5968910.1 hypothetical protein KGF57_000025 [Candida theae]